MIFLAETFFSFSLSLSRTHAHGHKAVAAGLKLFAEDGVKVCREKYYTARSPA